MLLGFAILAAAFVAAVRMLLVLHAGWGRAGASLTAFAICPLMFAAYAYTIEDSVTGGLALMIGLPIAVTAGLAGVGLAMLGDVLVKIGKAMDPHGGD